MYLNSKRKKKERKQWGYLAWDISVVVDCGKENWHFVILNFVDFALLASSIEVERDLKRRMEFGSRSGWQFAGCWMLWTWTPLRIGRTFPVPFFGLFHFVFFSWNELEVWRVRRSWILIFCASSNARKNRWENSNFYLLSLVYVYLLISVKCFFLNLAFNGVSVVGWLDWWRFM